MSDDAQTWDLLTEPEVAEMLRCSTTKIKRLRLDGKLTYLPGRPVLIERQAVRDYLERVRVPAKHTAVDHNTPEGKAELDRRGVEDARAWAVRQVAMKRILGR